MTWPELAPPPISPLQIYRILSPKAGLRVSPLCLGAMSIGKAWAEHGLGSMNEIESYKLLDEFFKLGGNFIDTANGYQDEESERWIGSWMKERKNRDQIVIATKFTSFYRGNDPATKIRVNYGGNATKSLRLSVEDSLKKLQTNYIDLLYLHWWDWTTSIEEVMQSLNNLVKEGKVLYLGISDTPAWIVSKANQYARDHGLAQFVVYQGLWSAMFRDFEREIIPMCISEGMALCPWGALGSGKFQSKADLEKRLANGENLRSITGPSQQTELERKISECLEKIGKEIGTDSVTAVALAYVLQKVPYVFPIIGGRKIEHLHSNITALTLRLTEDHIKEIENQTSDFKLGFPYDQFGGDAALGGVTPWHFDVVGKFEFVKHPQVRISYQEFL
ncbi:NADP-dependent oxidoreductase domain-containing protein [Melampsora americana]|nr:NADP-dependent oxidoreductase domain-containing protein [Melampsora americana]